VRHFALDFTASDVEKLPGLTRETVTSIFLSVGECTAEECERQSPFGGEVEVDESYFGARGKRGRGASGKTIVFGIFKRNGSVYTEAVPDCR
jgi:transposase